MRVVDGLTVDKTVSAEAPQRATLDLHSGGPPSRTASKHTIMAPTKSHRKPASALVAKPKKKSSAASTVGAPAQHNQSSRKGKKAWRKNVDIEDLEEKLEGLRDEERTLGCAFSLPVVFCPG